LIHIEQDERLTKLSKLKLNGKCLEHLGDIIR